MRRIGVHGAGMIPLSAQSATAPLGGALTPFSLSFDGVGDWVDCGNNASVMDLHSGDFTVDVYAYIEAQGSYADNMLYTMISQGRRLALEGWQSIFRAQVLPANRYDAFVQDGWIATAGNNSAFTTWHYFRMRKSGGTVSISVDAGAEGSDAAGGPVDTAADDLTIGASGDAHEEIYVGNICYVHIWNNNQGALGAVPTSPFAVDANTAARYIFSEGGGASLADDSGNANNGAITGATWSPLVPAGWSI